MTDHDLASKPCPVINVDYRKDRALFWTFDSLNQAREAAPVTWNTTTQGYWMINTYELAKEALKMPEVFSNRRVNAFQRGMEMKLLPQTLDGPEHTRLRALLNPWFSPGAVRRLNEFCCRRSSELIAEVAAAGTCDFVTEFAIHYPTDVFLHALGMPLEDGPAFVGWVEGIFNGFFDVDATAGAAAVDSVRVYFEALVDERAKAPREPELDFVSYLLGSELDGTSVPTDDVVTICSTIMLAGLDTTRSALGYIWHHLATHPDDRRRLLDDPAVRPRALEEFLRLYSLLIQDGRYVEEDVTFGGCPMHKGDMISVGIITANRDPKYFDHPDEFVFDRAPNPHIAFGLGAHRCLGMHLARHELAVAIDEWHARIPDYRLAEGADLAERGGQLSLRSLPLEWD